MLRLWERITICRLHPSRVREAVISPLWTRPRPPIITLLDHLDSGFLRYPRKKMAYDLNAEPGPSKGVIPYDPDQDPEERRGIRKRYRDLRAEIEGMSRLLVML